MSLMKCPHCGAKNFTMEGWEDLDHCASCGEPLGEVGRGSSEGRKRPSRRAAAEARMSAGRDAKRSRPA
jgi:hypothetical protein